MYWQVVPGIFRHLIRSLGFFSLLIVDHIPPIFSPWCAMVAWSSSWLLHASVHCKCFISCAMKFSLVLSFSLKSKFRLLVSSSWSFLSLFSLDLILNLESLDAFCVIFLMVFM